MSFISAAQDPIAIGFEMRANQPTTKDEFVKSEKNIINTYKEGKLEDCVKEAMKEK
jgi:hypothetical protein